MKVSGRNLARRLMLLGNALSRVKHRRGHGVHSPFVYSLVRKVFMSKVLDKSLGTALYDSLRDAGLAEKSARQLHNLLPHIEGQSYSINEVECDLSILLADYPAEQLRGAYEDAKAAGVILVVCYPYLSRERQLAVGALIADHSCTSVDNGAYTLFFNNGLPKQHYRL